MIDDYNAYYTHFCQNFQRPAHKSLCEWYVHRNFNGRIHKCLSWTASDARVRGILWKEVYRNSIKIQHLSHLENLPSEVMQLQSCLHSRRLPCLYRYLERRYLTRKELWTSLSVGEDSEYQVAPPIISQVSQIFLYWQMWKFSIAYFGSFLVQSSRSKVAKFVYGY